MKIPTLVPQRKVTEDGMWTVARARAVQALPIHWPREPCEIKNSLKIHIYSIYMLLDFSCEPNAFNLQFGPKQPL